MKNIIILLFLFLFTSCTTWEITETNIVNVEVEISDYYKMKYTRVNGVFKYQGKWYAVINELKGYYYKEYSFHINQKIQTKVLMTHYKSSEGENNIKCTFVDLTKYELTN